MIFPIGDDQVRGGHFPALSYLFIVLNVLIFVFQLQMSGEALEQFIFTYGSIPSETMQGQDLFTLVTSMFLHGGFMHLIGNMMFLWVFADNIEASVGFLSFLIFYFLGGMAAHAAHIYFNMSSQIPTVGASGAISAVLGAYLVMFPTSRVRVLFFVFVFKVPAILFLGFWIAQQWMSGTAALEVATEQSTGVAWWAHIGGFAFGLLGGLYYRASGATHENARLERA